MRGAVRRFDRVVIETSGLADPAPILQTLMTDAGVAGRLVLGSVVTTVDAVTGAATLEREGISQKQVAVADRIVLTKLDLAGDFLPNPRCSAVLKSSTPAHRCSSPIMAGSIQRRVFNSGLYDPATKSA